ncbi:hypothetical protein LOD99_14859 [Oopsacas minuta]|uniref:Secreted protein n=1 Tax=Oopsacas minuta TaxID=111878 RepID=A0AAV7KEQ3_9METZ|nr:hypothetical protein LOD99_14859 [Oopsacas minuta]
MGLIVCCVYYGCCCCLCEGEQQQRERLPRQQRSYNNQVVRRNQPAAQPLIVGEEVEQVIIDGVLVNKHITRVAGLTQSGRVQVLERERVIATDGSHAVGREATRVYKPN